MFGGVYLWAGLTLGAAVLALLAFTSASRADAPSDARLRALDLALLALLGAVALQAVPLPQAIVRTLSPARSAYVAATALTTPAAERFVPLTLDPPATLHAFVSFFCAVGTFWVARRLFARGGIRAFSTVVGWGAIAIALVAVAQHASGTTLIYGFWQPRDAGARPLGPFVNRNHFGTWSIMAICLCAGYLQWRGMGQPAVTWRARVARALDGRRLIMGLAVVLLAVVIGLGASRSTLVALACAAGYVALFGPGGGGRRLSFGLLAAVAVAGMLGYGDGQRLLMRIDETRAAGMTNRLAIWRDAVPLIRDFPLTGVGAGAFGAAMRVYQTSPRTYYHNEAHSQYIQVAAEGGALLTAPAVVALAAFVAAAWGRLRRRADPLIWMRIAAAGALVGAAVQSVWETGLTLPANGMLAAALAAIVVHAPRRTTHES